MREKGSLELILGTMFSRKSTHLILRLKELEHSTPYNSQLFTSIIDDRYAVDKIVTHDKLEMPCVSILDTEELITNLNSNTDVIAIDEIQFLDGNIINAIEEWINKKNKIVIVGGLLYNFRNEYFPFQNSEKTVHDLFELTPEKVDYRLAFCKHRREDETECNKPTIMTQRFMPDGSVAPYNDPLIMIGKQDISEEEKERLKRYYSPRCREHFQHYKENTKK